MDNQRSGKRLAAILLFLAAALGFTAAGIRFFNEREVDWAGAAVGVLLLAIGIFQWGQSRVEPPAGS